MGVYYIGLVVRRGNRIVMVVILRTANEELRMQPLLVWGLISLAILRVDGDMVRGGLGNDMEVISCKANGKPFELRGRTGIRYSLRSTLSSNSTERVSGLGNESLV